MREDLNLKELNKHIRIGRLEISAALVFIALLLYPFPTDNDRFFWSFFFDSGHPILFFLCTIFISRIYIPNPDKSKRRVILEAAVFSFLIACMIELVQPIFSRSASLGDVTLGSLGIICASFTLAPLPAVKAIGPLLLILVQSIAFVPATKAMEAIKWRKENFPLLADFEDSKQFLLLKGTYFLSQREKNNFIKIYQPLGEEYLIRYEAGDKDWSKFSYLNIEILNPLDRQTSIHIRIDDDQDCIEFEARYNSKKDLVPGWNKISIPLSEIAEGPETRTLDLKKIRYLYFFNYPEDFQWFGIDNLNLSN